MNAAMVISGLLAHTALVFLILANELDWTRSRITIFVPKPSMRPVSYLFACSLYIISVSLTSHIDEKCTSSQRRRQARHGSDSVYDQFYAPMNAGVDGQALYTGDTPRTLLFSLLRFLKMDHDRELAQTLPARELHELVTSEEYSAIRADLENLPDSDGATIKKERAEILGRLRGLKRTALKKYREQQKENPRTARTSKTKKTDEGDYRTPFYRIRHLMSIRERLSKSMFTIGTIRSQAGRVKRENARERG